MVGSWKLPLWCFSSESSFDHLFQQMNPEIWASSTRISKKFEGYKIQWYVLECWQRMKRCLTLTVGSLSTFSIRPFRDPRSEFNLCKRFSIDDSNIFCSLSAEALPPCWGLLEAIFSIYFSYWSLKTGLSYSGFQDFNFQNKLCENHNRACR